MTDRQKTQKPSLLRAIAVPALATAAGLGLGSFAGGAAAKGIIRSPGGNQWLREMSAAKRGKVLKAIRGASTAVGGAAGAVSAGLAGRYVQKEINKLEQRKSKANEKTAAVYSIYIKSFERMI
jgi:hypothetical protein